MSLTVIAAGMQTLIQDAGRPGFGSSGVGRSGASASRASSQRARTSSNPPPCRPVCSVSSTTILTGRSSTVYWTKPSASGVSGKISRKMVRLS